MTAGDDGASSRDSGRNRPYRFDPSRDVRLDARRLRGLAHPLRVALLSQLREHGPATATQLAARLQQSSGATSYHLRQLENYGLIVDEPSLGEGRERYWRSAHESTWLELTHTDPETRTLGAEYLRAVAHLYHQRMQRHIDTIETVEDTHPGWTGAGGLSDVAVHLTPDEARAVSQAIGDLLAHYPAARPGESAPAGKQRVVVQFQVLPQLDDDAQPDGAAR